MPKLSSDYYIYTAYATRHRSRSPPSSARADFHILYRGMPYAHYIYIYSSQYIGLCKKLIELPKIDALINTSLICNNDAVESNEGNKRSRRFHKISFDERVSLFSRRRVARKARAARLLYFVACKRNPFRGKNTATVKGYSVFETSIASHRESGFNTGGSLITNKRA